MSDYPYIGKDIESGSIALIYGKDSAIVMDRKTWAAKNGEDVEVEESYFKNITREYLSNTWGIVESKEHAEFIIELAGLHGVDVSDVYRDWHKFFAVIDNSLLFVNGDALAMKDGRKQITIPLPPECESGPFKNINPDNTEIMKFDIPDKKEKSTFSPTEITFNVPSGLDLSFDTIEQGFLGGNERHLIVNVTDNRVYEYDDSSDDEWPKVGDECVVTNDHDRILIYGHEVIGKKVNVLATYNTDNIDMAVVNFDGCGYCFMVDMLQKPKTPKQELREFLHLLWRENNEDFDDFADIAVLHLKKKGEIDE